MSIFQSLKSVWSSKTGKLITLLVIVCLLLAANLAFTHYTSRTATDTSESKTGNSGSANPAQNDLLPVTTTPSVPDTSGVNSPGNSGQDIQSQPNSTPETVSPQQAAPTSPEDVNSPATSTQTYTAPNPAPVTPRCGICGGGGGGYRKTQIACPQFCVQ